VIVVGRDPLESELLIVIGTDPLGGIDHSLFQCRIDVASRDLLCHHAEFGKHRTAKPAMRNFSSLISPNDNIPSFPDLDAIGAAWVFTRSGGVWTQQGNKLVGTGAVGNADQGWSVALSADGNTVIVGGPNDNAPQTGAAWVYIRSGGVWTQQGSKLVGTGAVYANQGVAVTLSADGNTAIVGGSYDNGNIGAAWVFTRSGGVWRQQAGRHGRRGNRRSWEGDFRSDVLMHADQEHPLPRLTSAMSSPRSAARASPRMATARTISRAAVRCRI
jgi:hypothetical protein